MFSCFVVDSLASLEEFITETLNTKMDATKKKKGIIGVTSIRAQKYVQDAMRAIERRKKVEASLSKPRGITIKFSSLG